MSENPLWEAVWNEDVDRTRQLLENFVDLNNPGRNGNTPLMQAAQMANIKLAKLLLEHGVDINAQGYRGATAINIAVGASIDGTVQNGGSPGDEPTEMINLLLERGADISIADSEVGTPLDWAKSYKSKKIIGLLTNENS